jgi:hypothetical protein
MSLVRTMASPEGRSAYSNLNTGGNAKVHAGNNYNSMTTTQLLVRFERKSH